MTREQMMRHEAWISKPVKELFPPDGPTEPAYCKVCKRMYTRPASCGKSRRPCPDCRRKEYEGRRRAPSR